MVLATFVTLFVRCEIGLLGALEQGMRTTAASKV